MKYPHAELRPIHIGILGVAVLVLLIYDIKDLNAPGIGLDVVLLGIIIYMFYKNINKQSKNNKLKK